MRADSPVPDERMRIDLHLHTRGSWDCLSDPEAVLERAWSRGIERIAITDHNRLAVAASMANRYPDRVIAGEEVKTAEGIDVIGLYLENEIPKGTPAVDVCRRIREQGGIVYLPHPFARGKGGDGRLARSLLPYLDVVEVFNSRLRSRKRNQRALELARESGLLQGAGSDAHTIGEIGNAWVELPRHPSDPESLREALRRATVHGRRAGLHVRLASNWAKLRKSVTRAS